VIAERFSSHDWGDNICSEPPQLILSRFVVIESILASPAVLLLVLNSVHKCGDYHWIAWMRLIGLLGSTLLFDFDVFTDAQAFNLTYRYSDMATD